MQKILILLLFTSTNLSAFCQRTKIDSLQKLLTSPKEDTATVKQYNNLSLYYYNIDSDSAFLYGNKALGLSKQIKWIKGQARSQIRLFDYFFKKGNNPKALSLALSSMEIYEKLKDTTNVIDCLNRIAGTYQEEEDYERAINYLKKAHALARSVNNQLWLSITCHNLGNNYSAIKMADSALVYFQESYLLSNAVTVRRDRGLAYSLYGLGTVHLLMNNTDLALSYLYKSMPFAVNVDDASLLGDIYYTTSRTFDKMGKGDSSLMYSERALTYALKDNAAKRLIDVYKQLTNLYKGKDNDKAVKYFELESALRDSLFTSQRKREMANLTYNEEERQKELETAERRSEEERKQNIQYAAIALGLVTFIILFLLLSRSIITNTKVIEFFGVVALLIVFEFLNLLLHPFLERVTHHSPLLMLLALVLIAALLVPVHHRLQKWMTHTLVEKNKKIRLAAAKKTIEQLETDKN